MTERVLRFYWKKIIYRYKILGAIVYDNETYFTNTMVIGFYNDLGVQNKLVSIVHPQSNG